MKALLIVDVQNDFLPSGALAVPRGDEIIPVINALMSHYELVVASKDWHPLHHCSFASEHGKQPFETIDYKGVSQELWPIHCVQETKGADFPATLNTDRITKVFYKGTDPEIDSYSAFFDNQRLGETGLKEYLLEMKVDELTVVGLATDYCVKFTVLDALHLGLKVTVVIDGCCAVNVSSGDEALAIQEMKAAGALF